MQTQDCTTDWELKNAVDRVDVWELTLSWWRVIRLHRLVFLISWETTGKEMVVYHNSQLTLLRCSSGTVAICPVFPNWIWHILRYPYSRLFFTFWIIRTTSRFTSTCPDVLDVFPNTMIVFFDNLLRLIRTILLLSNGQIVWDLTQRHFWQSNVYTIFNVRWSHQCLELSQSHNTSYEDPATSTIVFETAIDLGQPSKFVLKRTTTTNELTILSINTGSSCSVQCYYHFSTRWIIEVTRKFIMVLWIRHWILE